MSPQPPSVEPGSALFEVIVQQTPEAIIFADRSGVIRIWNGGAEKLFGFTAAEAIGNSLDLIIPERLRPAHWAGFDRAIAQGHTQHGAQIRLTRALHQDGRRLYVDMSFGVVTGGDGSVLGSVAMARDATTRRETETSPRSRIDELERSATGGAGTPMS